MKSSITSEVLVAYSQCPRKAFELFIQNRQQEIPEYVRLLRERERNNREQHIEALRREHRNIAEYTEHNFQEGYKFYHTVKLRLDDLEANCGILSRVNGKNLYQPTIFCGTYKIAKEKKFELLFVGYVLGHIQANLPEYGFIIGLNKRHKIKLEPGYKQLLPLLEDLRIWRNNPPTTPPSLLLTRQCGYCQYQSLCRSEATAKDHLSLLDCISTLKLLQKYEKKGIFTINQLSYLFKPRKPKTRKVSTTHRPELQALAIRTQKTYIHELPQLELKPIELFLDIEGIPDEQTYYLIGLLVREREEEHFYSFWADTAENEKELWEQFIKRIRQYPHAPIYHYGHYDQKAIEMLARRYDTNIDFLKRRLCNLTTYIYGKIYFPTTSNSLKDIGRFLGASWTHPLSSGLQSLVWRHSWGTTQRPEFKSILITYNREDCYALALLVKELCRINESANTLSEIDFADQPKQHSTAIGQRIHQEFETILQLAHEKYDHRKISFQELRDNHKKPQNTVRLGLKKGYQGQTKIRPKPTKIVEVSPLRNCPECRNRMSQKKPFPVSRLIIDLVFTKNGVRKIITKYQSERRYCSTCKKWHNPQGIDKYGKSQLYGRKFKAWVVYLRIMHRLPYQKIADIAHDQFHVDVSWPYFPAYIRDFAEFYTETNDVIAEQLLRSPFIHVDETPINIRGETQYVWGFTDGYYVLLRLQKTREATIVHEFLDGYNGVLIADFYPGYDSVKCLQQKCWVHLIRDLNEDLWKAPFDLEFERFVADVNNVITPIIEAVYKYGLKKRHLSKFKRSVETFYDTVITDKLYRSEVTQKYQKRFYRYRESLFTFLDYDNVAWHNNAAERALRHITKQEQISGNFHEALTHDYLVLLGIRQTCRFHERSFFNFLLSEQKNIGHFKKGKRI
jgi:predicted RecB family nuclease